VWSSACYKGFYTSNGAEGVGRSTTQAVVAGSVTVLILNYFLATWLLQIFPN
jgi:phospholipid/cholesterol/gamma-HCH transport system permease protein